MIFFDETDRVFMETSFRRLHDKNEPASCHARAAGLRRADQREREGPKDVLHERNVLGRVVRWEEQLTRVELYQDAAEAPHVRRAPRPELLYQLQTTSTLRADDWQTVYASSGASNTETVISLADTAAPPGNHRSPSRFSITAGECSRGGTNGAPVMMNSTISLWS